MNGTWYFKLHWNFVQAHQFTSALIEKIMSTQLTVNSLKPVELRIWLNMGTYLLQEGLNATDFGNGTAVALFKLQS
jgi:hypothetical protein